MQFLSLSQMPEATIPDEAVVPDRRSTVASHSGTVCEQCLAWCPDKEALWKHARNVHVNDVRLRCAAAGCGKRFSTLFASAAHRAHHAMCDGDGQVPYTCELCGRMSHNRSSFDRHVARAHPDARAVMCGVCSRYTGDVQSLAEHMNATHSAQVRFEVAPCGTAVNGGGGRSGVGPERVRHAIRCDVCGKRLANYRLLQSHMQLHRVQSRRPEQEPHARAAAAHPGEVTVVRSEHATAVIGKSGVQVCEQCFARCADKVALWKHARDVHGDDPRLRCAVASCGKRFSTLFASAAHRAHHDMCDGEGKVPYTCELCGRMSSNRLSFDRHVANVHPDAKAVMCGVCGRYAGDARSLTEHVDAVHGAQILSKVVPCNSAACGDGVGPVRTSRTIRCDVCGKRFGNNRLMRLHRQVHGDVKGHHRAELSSATATH